MNLNSTMNRFLLIALAALLMSRAAAQNNPPQSRTPPPGNVAQAPHVMSNEPASLTKFDLDFPGGTPSDLVRAIEKASGIPLNAIVPEEHADVKIPPLKMSSVNVPELFQALELASRKTTLYTTGFVDYGGPGGQRRQVQQAHYQFGFKTQGPPRDNSVWYFYYEKPTLLEEAKTCRFWQLESYLTTYKIEDITTAVQTGYKMLGEPAPTINFHKDTKLLIAVGEADKLNLIDSVLKELARPIGSKPGPASAPPPPTKSEVPGK